MEKEFIPYELALELKGLGFDEPCFATIDQTDYLHINGTKKLPRGSMMYDTIDCPTFSQVFRWFRDKHKLSCSIELTDNSRHYYFDFTIYDSKNRDYNDEDCFDSCRRTYDNRKYGKHEEAEPNALKKLIEIVKNK